MSFFTPDEAREYAERLTDEAISHLSDIDESEGLISLALYLCDRES